jgi:hypothetical protein
METNNLLIMGVSCLAAAIAGGGLRFFGLEIPLLSSMQRQVLLGMLGLGLISPTAYSELATINKTHQCELYADEAVSQYDVNIDHICGLVGERWHDVYAGHKGWCLTQSDGSIQNESSERKKALESCT